MSNVWHGMSTGINHPQRRTAQPADNTTVQRTVTHCNTLQHTGVFLPQGYANLTSNTLQTYCNTLYHSDRIFVPVTFTNQTMLKICSCARNPRDSRTQWEGKKIPELNESCTYHELNEPFDHDDIQNSMRHVNITHSVKRTCASHELNEPFEHDDIQNSMRHVNITHSVSCEKTTKSTRQVNMTNALMLREPARVTNSITHELNESRTQWVKYIWRTLGCWENQREPRTQWGKTKINE